MNKALLYEINIPYGGFNVLTISKINNYYKCLCVVKNNYFYMYISDFTDHISQCKLGFFLDENGSFIKLNSYNCFLPKINRYCDSILDKCSNLYNKKVNNILFLFEKAPQDVIDSVINYIITGDIDNKKYITNNDYFYDIERNVMYFLFNQHMNESDLQAFLKFLPEKAKYSSLAKYVTKFTRLCNGFELIDVIDKENPCFLELGIDPHVCKDAVEHCFKFNIPVCKNINCTAGILNMPKKFYNNNKEKIHHIIRQYAYYPFFKIIVNSPDEILECKTDDIFDAIQLLKAIEKKITISNINKIAKECDRICRTSPEFYRYTYQMIIDYYKICHFYRLRFVPINLIDDAEAIESLHDRVTVIQYSNACEVSPKAKEEYLEVKKTYLNLNYENDEFIIKYPDSIEDLYAEGRALHHCVGSYVNSVIKKYAYIMFLRKKNDINTSFVTLHYSINKENIILQQAHGDHNCSVSKFPGVKEFIDEWCKKFNIKQLNINRAL